MIKYKIISKKELVRIADFKSFSPESSIPGHKVREVRAFRVRKSEVDGSTFQACVTGTWSLTPPSKLEIRHMIWGLLCQCRTCYVFKTCHGFVYKIAMISSTYFSEI